MILREHRCEKCGAVFESGANNVKYCPDCRKKRRTSGKPGGAERKRSGRNRPYTKDTAKWIRKWHDEGMTIKELMKLLDRSIENIMPAFKD